jgi:hypothetical protein
MWFTDSGSNSIGRITTKVTPTIIGFTPTSGRPGTLVTITGLNLLGATRVAFNGASAAIVSDTATKVVTKVPAGAGSGHITVTTAVGTATTTKRFYVT